MKNINGALLDEIDRALAAEIDPRPRSKRQWRPGQMHITLESLKTGMNIVAGPGSGKSRYLGRVLLWVLWCMGIPIILLDPLGTTGENFLDKLIRKIAYLLGTPEEVSAVQHRIWSRVKYYDMGGTLTDYVPQFPIIRPLDSDRSLSDQAWRFIETILATDMDLLSAPMQGANALRFVGKHTLVALAGMGLQISEASDFLRDPSQYRDRLLEAEAKTDDWSLREAVRFFTKPAPDYWTKGQWEQKKETLIRKIALLEDNVNLAQFGASEPSLDFDEILAKGKLVILDFKRELHPSLRQIKMRLVVDQIINFARSRGSAGRKQPFVLCIDEVTQLYRGQAGPQVAEDLNELLAVYGRNNGVISVISSQNFHQKDQKTNLTLLQLGCQLIGNIQTQPDAEFLARQYIPLQDSVKHWNRVWTSSMGESWVIDHQPVFRAPEEIYTRLARLFMNLTPFEFIAKIPRYEGDYIGHISKLNIKNLDPGEWPAIEVIEAVQRRLMEEQASTVFIPDALNEIKQRQTQVLQPPRLESNARSSLEAPDELQALYEDHGNLPFGMGDDGATS